MFTFARTHISRVWIRSIREQLLMFWILFKKSLQFGLVTEIICFTPVYDNRWSCQFQLVEDQYCVNPIDRKHMKTCPIHTENGQFQMHSESLVIIFWVYIALQHADITVRNYFVEGLKKI